MFTIVIALEFTATGWIQLPWAQSRPPNGHTVFCSIIDRVFRRNRKTGY